MARRNKRRHYQAPRIVILGMTAKEYLQSIRTLDIKLKTLESRISRYREDICTLKGTDLKQC